MNNRQHVIWDSFVQSVKSSRRYCKQIETARNFKKDIKHAREFRKIWRHCGEPLYFGQTTGHALLFLNRQFHFALYILLDFVQANVGMIAVPFSQFKVWQGRVTGLTCGYRRVREFPVIFSIAWCWFFYKTFPCFDQIARYIRVCGHRKRSVIFLTKNCN